MEWFEKIYKDRFNKHQSLDGIDSNALWSSISGSIVVEESTSAKKTLFWIFASIFFLTTLGIVFYPSKTTTENDVTTITESIAIDTKSKTLSNSLLDKSESNTNTTENKQIVAKNQTAIQRTLDRNLQLSNYSNQKTTNQTYVKNNTSKASYNKGIQTHISSPSKHTSNTKIPYDLKSIFENTVKEMSQNGLPHSIGIDVRKNQESSFLKASILNQFAIAKLFNIPKTKKGKSKNRKFELSLLIGANTFSTTYQDIENNYAERLNKAHNNELGYYSSLGLKYHINKTLFISTGASYNVYENRFEDVFTTDTMVLVGETNPVYRQAKNMRTIRNHNKFTTLTIPLTFGVKKNFNRISLGAEAGVSYSIVLSQIGKIMNSNGEVMEYTNENKAIYSNHLNYVASPFIQYHINDKMSLLIQLSASYQNHKKSTEMNFKQNSLMFSSGIGLSYRM